MPNLMHLLIGFLVIAALLVVLWGLLQLIEWAMGSAIPQPVKLVVAIILFIGIVIWVLTQIMGAT